MTYINYFDQNCVRDGIQELYLLVLKDDHAETFSIETKYSHFIDYELREDYTDKYSFEWSITNIIASNQNAIAEFPDYLEP